MGKVQLSDIIMGIGLSHFGRGHWAMSANPISQFFDSRFHWRLGYNLSL